MPRHHVDVARAPVAAFAAAFFAAAARLATLALARALTLLLLLLLLLALRLRLAVRLRLVGPLLLLALPALRLRRTRDSFRTAFDSGTFAVAAAPTTSAPAPSTSAISWSVAECGGVRPVGGGFVGRGIRVGSYRARHRSEGVVRQDGPAGIGRWAEDRRCRVPREHLGGCVRTRIGPVVDHAAIAMRWRLVARRERGVAVRSFAVAPPTTASSSAALAIPGANFG